MTIKYNHYSHQSAKSLLSLNRPITRNEIRLLFPSRTWASALLFTFKGQTSASAWLQAAHTLRSNRFGRKAANLENKVGVVHVPKKTLIQDVGTSSSKFTKAAEVALVKCRKVEAAVTRRYEAKLKVLDFKIGHLEAKIADCKAICSELDHLRSIHKSGIERRDKAMTNALPGIFADYTSQEVIRRKISQHSLDNSVLFYSRESNRKALKMLCFGRKLIYNEADAASFDIICNELQYTCGPTLGYNGDSCSMGVGLIRALACMLYNIPVYGGPVLNWTKLTGYYDTYVTGKIDDEKWNPFA